MEIEAAHCCGFWQYYSQAGVAQLVESQLPKLVVASSNLVARSRKVPFSGKSQFIAYSLPIVGVLA